MGCTEDVAVATNEVTRLSWRPLICPLWSYRLTQTILLSRHHPTSLVRLGTSTEVSLTTNAKWTGLFFRERASKWYEALERQLQRCFKWRCTRWEKMTQPEKNTKMYWTSRFLRNSASLCWNLKSFRWVSSHKNSLESFWEAVRFFFGLELFFENARNRSLKYLSMKSNAQGGLRTRFGRYFPPFLD